MLTTPSYFFSLERAGELRINILRSKRGKDPQNVIDNKGLQPTQATRLRDSYKKTHMTRYTRPESAPKWLELELPGRGGGKLLEPLQKTIAAFLP